MNKVILLGRLTKDPETRYSQGATPTAVTRYTLAVNRKFKRQGEPEADFFNCIAFGKAGEFAEKYFRKGQMVGVVGRLSVNSWEDKTGAKRTTTEVVVEDQYFAESAASSGGPKQQTEKPGAGFYPVDESLNDDDLPF